MLTVILGGARSGKSTSALRLAERAEADVTFIATSPKIDGDDDLTARIAAHQAERPGHWTTVEEEVDLAEAINRTQSDGLVIIDCLTVWVGNLFHAGTSDADIETRSDAALAAIARRTGRTIAVTNEVGLGIVPADAMSRRYRDVLGRTNQRWVAAAEDAHLLIAGRALPLTELGGLIT